MPFWRVYYHLVWATKNREPFITAEIEQRVHSYLVNKAIEIGLYVYAIGGWYDHVHLVVAIPPKLAIADAVKRLKGASSFDLNYQLNLGSRFSWQRGYGVFTLGESQRSRAEEYVRNQKEHHSRQTTNYWLERVDEVDEGPMLKGLVADPVLPLRRALRESELVYGTEDDFPF
jgi:putative transposase